MSLIKDEQSRGRARHNTGAAKNAQRIGCEPQEFKAILMRVFESYADVAGAATASQDLGQGSATLRQGRIDLDALRVHCDRLEHEVRSVRERSRLDVEALADESAQWQAVAADLGNRLWASQRQLADALDASGRLQDRLESECAKLEAARQRTRILEQIAVALHDKILESFKTSDPRSHRLVAAAA